MSMRLAAIPDRKEVDPDGRNVATLGGSIDNTQVTRTSSVGLDHMLLCGFVDSTLVACICWTCASYTRSFQCVGAQSWGACTSVAERELSTMTGTLEAQADVPMLRRPAVHAQAMPFSKARNPLRVWEFTAGL